jgi:hypothetical protein
MQEDKTNAYSDKNNVPGFMVSLYLSTSLSISNNGGIMLQDDKSTHKYHALMVNFL